MDWRLKVSTMSQSLTSDSLSQPNFTLSPKIRKNIEDFKFNRVDIKEIWNLLKFYLSAQDLLNFRLISKSVFEIIQTFPNVWTEVTYNVAKGSSSGNGSVNAYTNNSPLETLFRSTFPWRHVKFTGIHLEQDLLGIQLHFIRFARKFCPNLKSLSVIDCSCGLGRFMELLSFCGRLEDLKIVNCPGILNQFSTEVGLYQGFVPGFYKRLSLIKRFTLIDSCPTESAITVPRLKTWVRKMRHLESFDLRWVHGNLRMTLVGKVLTRNSNTLRHLSIVGQCYIDGRFLSIMSNLTLRSLRLGSIEFPSYNSLQVFLQGQSSSLESLHLYDLSIHQDCFQTLAGFTKLSQLHLEDTQFIRNRSEVRGHPHPLAQLVTLTDLRIQNLSCADWKSLFRTRPVQFQLTTLVLNFKDNHWVKCFPVIESLDGLKVMVLTGIGTTKGTFKWSRGRQLLMCKLAKLKNLEKLELIDSNLSDGDLMPPPYLSLANVPSLLNLTNLVMLNLSRTLVGDEFVTKGFIHLSSVQALYVDQTQVSYTGLKYLAIRKYFSRLSFFRGTGPILPNFRFLSARQCLGMHVAVKLLDGLKLQLNGVQFYCDYPKIQSTNLK